MQWAVGDWVVYDRKFGQIKELRENGSASFSDGWFETSGQLCDNFRPLTLRNKRIAEWFDTIYKRLYEIDGHRGFNFPDISHHFSDLARKAIDAGDEDAQPFIDAANEFVTEARQYAVTIEGVALFRRAA